MKITLKQAVDSKVPVSKLSQVKLPIKIAYTISRVASRLKSFHSTFTERKFSLIKQYGEKTGKENLEYTVKTDHLEVFGEEFKKLENEEVEVGFEKIKIADMGDIVLEPELLPEWLFE